MNEKVFELGERRRVTLEVWLSNGQTFTPANSTWDLSAASYPSPEASGSCDVREVSDKWQLTAEVEPKRRSTYKLQFTFGMGTEIVKRSVQIRVA